MDSMSRLAALSQDLTLDEYRELAEFRHQIRSFQTRTEQHAVGVGLDLSSCVLLLAVQGLPEGAKPTLETLAERLCLPPERVAGLVDNAVGRGDLTRSSPEAEGVGDWVKLTRTGRESLRLMSLANRDELNRSGPDLVRSLLAVVKQHRRRNRGVA